MLQRNNHSYFSKEVDSKQPRGVSSSSSAFLLVAGWRGDRARRERQGKREEDAQHCPLVEQPQQ